MVIRDCAILTITRCTVKWNQLRCVVSSNQKTQSIVADCRNCYFDVHSVGFGFCEIRITTKNAMLAMVRSKAYRMEWPMVKMYDALQHVVNMPCAYEHSYSGVSNFIILTRFWLLHTSDDIDLQRTHGVHIRELCGVAENCQKQRSNTHRVCADYSTNGVWRVTACAF